MHQNYQKAIDGQITIELVKSHNNKSYCTCRKQQANLVEVAQEESISKKDHTRSKE